MGRIGRIRRIGVLLALLGWGGVSRGEAEARRDLAPSVVTASFLDGVRWRESRGQARAVGRAGERGAYQIRAGTWQDISARRAAAGQWTAGFGRAFEPGVARVYASAHLRWLEGELGRRLMRRASAGEVYGAYQRGLEGFLRN